MFPFIIHIRKNYNGMNFAEKRKIIRRYNFLAISATTPDTPRLSI